MTSPHLLVRIGESAAALPAAAVRRVIRTPRLHALPAADAALLGLAEFAGEPLAVLDLAGLLGRPAPAAAPPAVTVVAWLGPDDERELVGLAVDEALEVAALDPAAASGAGGAGGGEVLVGERPVRLLDPRRLAEAAP
ncbi:MAG: chemotaxis protein CheW [Thermoanaerobaculia bacterium]|nr:chemotaxis protein CheW [Thermoanaerobaculia bacterium]MCZ7652220.1 chemotaxis protein CheW [Thermoanaerobaculia bacterium]